MMPRTRYFVIASLLVLTVGLGTGLVAYYAGFPASAVSTRRGPEELQFVPADVALVAFADVHAIMTSPLREKLLAIMPGRGNGRQEFSSQTGINIETDIDRVVVAAARASGPHADGGGMTLARGRFDAVKIEALMRDRGARVEEVHGRRLIVGQSADGKHAVSLAFLEPGLIAVGSSEMVRAAAILVTGGQNVTGNAEVMSLLGDLESGNAWAVGRFDALGVHTSLPSGVGGKIPPIRWFSASAFVDSGLRGVLRAETDDEMSANNLRDVVRGIMALARLQSARYPGVDTALQSLDLSGSGTTVALSFDVPSELFDLLASLGASRSNVPQ